MNTILIADDDTKFIKALSETFRRAFAVNFQGRRTLEILEATSGREALELMGERRDIRCALLDYDFSKWGGVGAMNGLEIAEKMKAKAPDIEIIMMSEVARIREVNEAHTFQHIRTFIDKVESKRLAEELLKMFSDSEQGDPQAPDPRTTLTVHGFRSTSQAMTEVCRAAVEAALSDYNVLIMGETGTGKSELARAIHAISVSAGKRADIWRQVNCSAIPAEDLGRVLFGEHAVLETERQSGSPGLLDTSVSGTCFLNEITEIPARVQSELSHGLDPGSGRLGARIIAATNERVNDAIARGALRQDLFYRFDQIIVIPPLRDRVGDIPELVDEALERCAATGTSGRCTMAPEALSLLQRQPWIGNVRQLNRVVKRAAARTTAGVISVGTVQGELRIDYGIDTLASTGAPLTAGLARTQFIRQLLGLPRGADGEIIGGVDEILKAIRREILVEMLRETKGNQTEAAKRLGRSRLTEWIKELGISPEEYQ